MYTNITNINCLLKEIKVIELFLIQKIGQKLGQYTKMLKSSNVKMLMS